MTGAGRYRVAVEGTRVRVVYRVGPGAGPHPVLTARHHAGRIDPATARWAGVWAAGGPAADPARAAVLASVQETLAAQHTCAQ